MKDKMMIPGQMINSYTDKITELQEKDYCVLKGQFRSSVINECRDSFWPFFLTYLKDNGHKSNRGSCRHFLPMPFDPPCFVPDFFFDTAILNIIQNIMGNRIVADQWGCDVPLKGSEHQNIHVDFQRPLFSEIPDILLPPYILLVSFGLTAITSDNGAIEIAPGTHRMERKEALLMVESGEIKMLPMILDTGDVLIRHPWALHRGTQNTTGIPRALVSIRYVRD